ncbi:hypothetical protein AAC387_Pa05g1265 [Persea americana]
MPKSALLSFIQTSTINIVLNSLKGKKQKQTLQIESLFALEKEVKIILTVLGLMSSSTCSKVLEQLKDKAFKRAGLIEDEVLQQIEDRALARKNKEYAKSNELRKKLFDIGIALMDVPVREQYGDHVFHLSNNNL